jgi:hypothetical protein
MTATPLNPNGAILNTVTPLNPNGAILNSATPLNPNGAILNTNGISPSGSFASPFGPYPTTVPGMQSWAGFYGGNVQAPSFLPQMLGFAQAGAAPSQPEVYSGDWANPQTWANYFGGQYGFTAPQGAGTPAGALSAEQVSNPYDPALLGWEQDFGNPQTYLQNNTNWAQSLGTPNLNNQAWMNPAAWEAYFRGTEGFTAPSEVNSPAAALAAAAASALNPANPSVLGWIQDYGQPVNTLANNNDWAASLGTPPTNGNYASGIGAWESPLAWAALYGNFEGFSGYVNTLSGVQGFENIKNPNDPSLLGWELDYGNPQTVAALLNANVPPAGQPTLGPSNAQQTYQQQLAAYNQQVATYNAQVAAQRQQAASDAAQAQAQQSLETVARQELSSDQSQLDFYLSQPGGASSSEAQFLEEQIGLFNAELGNEQQALQSYQSAEEAATAQAQQYSQSLEGLVPPVQPPPGLETGPPGSRVPQNQNIAPTTPGGVEIFPGQSVQPGGYLAALGGGGFGLGTIGGASGTNPTNAGFGLGFGGNAIAGDTIGVENGFNQGINFGTVFGPEAVPYGGFGSGTGYSLNFNPTDFGTASGLSFDTLEFGAPNVAEFSGPPGNFGQSVADALGGLATTQLAETSAPEFAPPVLPPDMYLPLPNPLSPSQQPPGPFEQPIFVPPDFGGLPPELSNPAQIPYMAAPNAPVPQDLAVIGGRESV